MIKWKKYKNLIPNKVQLTKDIYYEVLWTKEFLNDSKQLGETRFDTRQILININQSDKEALTTFIHEVLHALSAEYDLSLTETQVSKMEKPLYYIIKLILQFRKD